MCEYVMSCNTILKNCTRGWRNAIFTAEAFFENDENGMMRIYFEDAWSLEGIFHKFREMKEYRFSAILHSSVCGSLDSWWWKISPFSIFFNKIPSKQERDVISENFKLKSTINHNNVLSVRIILIIFWSSSQTARKQISCFFATISNSLLK